MPNQYLFSIEQALLRRGIAGKHVRRTVGELQDHFDDLIQDGLRKGKTPGQARASAKRRLGRPRQLVRELADPAFMAPAVRWPLLGSALRSALTVMALPAMPFLYFVGHGVAIAKWGAAVGISALFTASLLLAMQLAILSS